MQEEQSISTPDPEMGVRPSEAMPWLNNYPKGVDYHMSFANGPVYGLLDRAAAQYPKHDCMDFLGKTYSYQETLDLVNRFARGLQERGLKKGDRVALMLPNCPYYIITFFGTLKAGGVVVNLNPLYSARELKHKIEDSRSRFLVTLDLAVMIDKSVPLLEETQMESLIIGRMADILPPEKKLLFCLFKRKSLAKIPDQDERYLPFAHVIRNDGACTPAEINSMDDLAVLQYTGGTTGTPKAAMLTHANIHINAEQASAWFPHAEHGRERMLAVIPFFHVFAMTAAMNLAINIGSSIYMLPQFDVKKVLQTIQKKKITLFPAVPTIYTAINHYPQRDRYDLSSVKFCISGGAALPLEVKQTFEAVTGCTLCEGYGLSETSPVATVNPIEGTSKTGSIGLPVPGTKIAIISLEDGETELPLGEIGEICIIGPQVMKGYYKKEAETRQFLKNGRLHTGDVGYMDEEGYSYIVDRLKDVIIAGGFNIYPRNVEEQIYMHEAVEECVVAGVPDEYRGETVKAWVRLKAGYNLSEDELKAYLKDKLSRIEIPKLIEFRTKELPKTMIGKLSRKDLLAEEMRKRAADQAQG